MNHFFLYFRFGLFGGCKEPEIQKHPYNAASCRKLVCLTLCNTMQGCSKFKILHHVWMPMKKEILRAWILMLGGWDGDGMSPECPSSVSGRQSRSTERLMRHCIRLQETVKQPQGMSMEARQPTPPWISIVTCCGPAALALGGNAVSNEPVVFCGWGTWRRNSWGVSRWWIYDSLRGEDVA